MRLVLSWPVRALVVGLLVFTVVVDLWGVVYRVVNHYPLQGSVPGLPPTVNGVTLYLHRGLDLQGGTHLELQMSNFPPGQNRGTVQQETVSVIQARVNALGTSEPVVEPAGTNNDRIIVELAGVGAAEAEAVIGQTARLVTTTWVADPSITGGPRPGFRPKITDLTSGELQSANASLDSQTSTQWVVNLSFDSSGASKFGALTTAAVAACPGSNDCPQRHIAEWLDLTQADVDNWNEVGAALYVPYERHGKLLTDPTIIQPITGGQAQISGGFTQSTAKDLATLLNSGSLPVSLAVIQSTEVGASLGSEAVRRSLVAGVLGLAIVVVFMIAFYRLPGLLASLALFFYAGVVLAAFKVIPVTLTLAGLAGFVLSVGMAVDANVLIFERFKEELRSGRTITAGVDAAVRRAWPAIRDSNTSTLITCTLLAFLGSGSVRGFAVTLGLGVLVSLISAIIVTHNLLALVLNSGWARGERILGVQRGRG